MMVVVGGRNSANTKELTRLCEIEASRRSRSRARVTSTTPRRFGERKGRWRHRRHVDADRGSRAVAERIYELAGTDRAAATPDAWPARR